MTLMFGLSTRFVLSVVGGILILFAVLYGVHKVTGRSSDSEMSDSELAENRSMRRKVEKGGASGNRGRHDVSRTSMKATNEDEKIIMDVAAVARLEVVEQQKAQRERMAPLMEKRREFFASLEKVEDEQERNRLRMEWMEQQREKMMAARKTQDSESARKAQRLAGMGMKLQSLRRYDLIPELKPQAGKIRSLMAQYAKQHENSESASNQALWTQIEQSIQELRMQHQKLMHPEKFR